VHTILPPTRNSTRVHADAWSDHVIDKPSCLCEKLFHSILSSSESNINSFFSINDILCCFVTCTMLAISRRRVSVCLYVCDSPGTLHIKKTSHDPDQVFQEVTQNAMLLFLPVKFNFCRENSAANVLYVKTSRGNVVATLFLHLTVHRRIAGDILIFLKFVLKVTRP